METGGGLAFKGGEEEGLKQLKKVSQRSGVRRASDERGGGGEKRETLGGDTTKMDEGYIIRQMLLLRLRH
jgi:hypothetical protein